MNLSVFKSVTAAVGISAAVLCASSAGAVVVSPTDYEGSYAATSVTTGGNQHTVWLPNLFAGVNAYWQFVGGPGTFVVGVDNATATLDGVIQNNVESGYQFDLDVDYALRDPNEVGTGGGKKGGIDAPLDNSIIDTWSFFDMTSATLTGLGDLAGLTLTLATFPDLDKFPFQLGEGANDKDNGLGGANWFSWDVATDANYQGPSVSDSSGNQHGDINVQLTPVPLPAGGLFLIAGIAGLGAMRRRKATS